MKKLLGGLLSLILHQRNRDIGACAVARAQVIGGQAAWGGKWTQYIVARMFFTRTVFISNNPLARNPFALSLSKGHSWFDKLTTNGLYRHVLSNGLFGFMVFAGLLVFSLPADAAGDKCETWPAWKNFRNNYVDESGRVIDRSVPQHITTSEGQSYALMFALIANDRDSFESVLRWTESNLANGDLTGQLPAWQWGKREDGSWGVIDSTAASDADLWIAYALGEAGRLWKIQKYSALAELLADRILREEAAEIPGLGLTLLPGTKGFHPDEATWRLNPSYLPIQIMRRFAAIYPKSGWDKLAASSLKVITGSAPLGFAPEWADYHAKNGFQAGDQAVSEGSFNAIRVYLWSGMLDSRDPAYSVLLKKLAPMGRHVTSNGVPPREINIFSGTSNGSGPVGFSAALLPFLKAAGMTVAHHQQSQRIRALSPLDRIDNYYDQVLILFGLGWIEGRYKFDRNGLLKPQWTCTKN